MSEYFGLDTCPAAPSWVVHRSGDLARWTCRTPGTRLNRLGIFWRAGVDGEFLAAVIDASLHIKLSAGLLPSVVDEGGENGIGLTTCLSLNFPRKNNAFLKMIKQVKEYQRQYICKKNHFSLVL